MKIKTNWNLKLLYSSDRDPEIEEDCRKAEAAHQAFAGKYARRSDYLSDEKLLVQALADYTALSDMALAKPILYYSYRTDLDRSDHAAEGKLNLLTQRYAKSSNQVTFFTLAISQIKLEEQVKFLKSSLLAPYRYFLKTLFRHGRHLLSEREEVILNLKHLPAYSLWVEGTEKQLSRSVVKWRGKKLPLAEAMETVRTLPTAERHKLDREITAKLKELAPFAENELNAIVTDKKIEDDLRGFSSPEESIILDYENDSATVQNLVSVVSRNFHLSHRFYKLKAKMHGLKKLTYVDREARLRPKRKKAIPFPQAVGLIQCALRSLDPIYGAMFDQFLQNGQIDVYPRANKTSGAYCSSQEKLPVYILLNYLPNLDSVITLAHELGHAFHSRLSADKQPPLYRGYSTATAEVASTFFENFVFEEIFARATPSGQVTLLHDRIGGAVATIFRQIACFNFELELHKQIREQGTLKAESMAALMNKHMQSYLGPVFALKPDDGYFFVHWYHLRRYFYVYSYAFGKLVSNALYSKYKMRAGVGEMIKKFLQAGGSASPEDIFNELGLNLKDPKFFELGLIKIEDDIEQLEGLVK